jgi:hypothetical protein
MLSTILPRRDVRLNNITSLKSKERFGTRGMPERKSIFVNTASPARSVTHRLNRQEWLRNVQPNHFTRDTNTSRVDPMSFGVALVRPIELSAAA